MRFLLALLLLCTVNISQAWVTFDGSNQTLITSDQWRELGTNTSTNTDTNELPNWPLLASQLDNYTWHQPSYNINPNQGYNMTHSSHQNKLLRADIRISKLGQQRPLLVLPYAFIHEITVTLVADGKVLMQQSLNAETDKASTSQRIQHAFGLVSLPITAPGDYQLLIYGSDLANSVIIKNAQLQPEDDYLLHDNPVNIAIASAFLGAVATYLLFCLALLIYRARPLFFYAALFLSGAFTLLLIREGLLFLTFPAPLEMDWWSKYILPIAMGVTYSSFILYLYTDLKGSEWRRLRRFLGICGKAMLAISLLNIVFPTRDNAWLNTVNFCFTLPAFIAALFLILTNLLQGGLRNILFGVCFGSFCLLVLARLLLSFFIPTSHIPALAWYIVVDLVGTYIFFGYLLTITDEHIKDKSRKASDLARLDLVNRFSHELRTPLNAVIGLADLLKESKEVSKVKNYAGMIHSAGYTLLALVNDILDFSKLGNSEAPSEQTAFRLDQLVTEVFSGFLPRIIENQIYVQTIVDPNLSFFLLDDELRVKQVFGNLISNAIKFSKPGGMVTLSINQGRSNGGRIELLCSVTDTGRGIPADKLASIFLPFSQVEAQDSSLLGGTGLGLAICKLLVEQNGGTLTARSKLGKGSIFSFNLWLTVDPNAPALAHYFAPFKGKSILLISKLATLTNQLQLPLEHWGAELTVVEHFIDAPTQHYDLIISESKHSCSAADVMWINQQPASTAIQLFDMISASWLDKITHANFRLLTIPCPMLSILSALAEHLGGTALEQIKTQPSNDVALIQQHSVLLVDDNKINLMVASKLLASIHVPCDTADGGVEALAMLKADHQYSLVLMDCEMPDIDGFEATRQWRAYEQQQQREHLPIVALTAHALNEVRDECLVAGMDEVLYKPIGRAVLLQLLNRYPGIAQTDQSANWVERSGTQTTH